MRTRRTDWLPRSRDKIITMATDWLAVLATKATSWGGAGPDRHGVFEQSEPASADSEGLPKVRIGTRPVEVFEYSPEMRDKKARFSIAWINDRGEIGPESEMPGKTSRSRR